MHVTSNLFVRRTTLGEDEYRKNFRQIDRAAIGLLKSAEARKVTHLMGTLYLTLIDAPPEYWEREGVLRFTGDEGEGGVRTAWRQLIALLDCGNTTAKKALDWMHDQGIIGYYAGKNGAGIRIFINRAASSIGRRGKQKNLRLVHTPDRKPHTPMAGTAFNVPFGDLEVSETDFNPYAPKSGAERVRVDNSSPEPSVPRTSPAPVACGSVRRENGEREAPAASTQAIPLDEIVSRLRVELEPRVTEVAARTAARTAQQEAESTRVWFKTKALPQAVRVAQRETYDLARKLGRAGEGPRQARADFEVGRQRVPVTPPAAKPSTDGEVRETAETCVALLEAQGKPVKATLAEISVGGGGWLLAEDVPRVRAEVESILASRGGGGET